LKALKLKETLLNVRGHSQICSKRWLYHPPRNKMQE